MRRITVRAVSDGLRASSSLPPKDARFPAATFLPPRLPQDLVDRPRLRGRIGPNAATHLSLVVGPPGSGKTTLVATWLASVDEPRAWVTVDPDVGQADRFWSALMRTIQPTCPQLVFDASDLIDADHADGSTIARSIVDDLTGARDPPSLIVVLDDAHLLEPTVWTDLGWLIEHQPPNLHLVVISRVDPPISMARWRARRVRQRHARRRPGLRCRRDGHVVRTVSRRLAPTT